jgi:DNA polymerase III subunit gamma/tau
MVRTLSNAFETGRIPQAWILTGVRGVGKTTTARILARALNYDCRRLDPGRPSMPRLGVHCQAIMESRHIDVIEMDAASHNGVDDMRRSTTRALRAGQRALQGLHPRRSPHAVDGRASTRC